MFYTIYKITNKLDGKIYIGKHQTQDLKDGYMGSGIVLKRAIDKHGLENFTKDILFIFDNEEDMNKKESELVNEDFVKDNNNYNLCPGGNGGFGYINSTPGIRNGFEHRTKDNVKLNERAVKKLKSLHKVDITWKKVFCKSVSDGLKEYFKINPGTFTGKSHSDESKRKIGEKNSKMTGSKNSQFGTMWITDGINNKKIKKNIDIIPEGWYKGRVIN